MLSGAYVISVLGTEHKELAALFAEEPGLLLEVASGDVDAVLDAYTSAGVAAAVVGSVLEEPRVSIAVGDAPPQISGSTPALRDAWEATGFRLERLQARSPYSRVLMHWVLSRASRMHLSPCDLLPSSSRLY